ncbi:MAG: glycosyltransferase family 4 protein [Planctomycetota bacterium]|nr:glycosyltransferase family 4 protein [Planctomycetota bacterium]
MRVLVLVDHAVGISGPHRNVVGTLNALAARDDVSVRLLTGRIDPDEPYARSGKIETIPGYDPHSPAAFFRNVSLLRKAARGCDCIYVPSGLKSFLYAQLVRRGRRLVAGPNVTRLPIRRADSPGWIELRLMCDMWLEASDCRRGHVLRYVGSAFEGRVRRVHHAINPSKFSPAKRDPYIWRKYGLDNGRLKIVWVGKDYHLLKGAAIFLSAADIYRQRNNTHAADFVAVGTLSDKNAKKAQNCPNVHHIGPAYGNDLAVLYASADVSVVPSSWENMPFVVLEAMASGLAVLATRTGGIPEQIEDGVSGLLLDLCDKERGGFRADAPEILAMAVKKVAEDADLRKRLGDNARRKAMEYFSEPRLGVEMATIFREVAGENT